MRTPQDYARFSRKLELYAARLARLARAGRNRLMWEKAADYAERRRVAATDAIIEELIGE